MSEVYTVVHESGNKSFTYEHDADAFMRYLDGGTKVISKLELSLNVKSYINWMDIPHYMNFIYKDSTGVYACIYKPDKIKYFNSNYNVVKMYGGEKIKLPYKNYHNLLQVGQYYETPIDNNNHFINWNVIKKSKYIKFTDNSSQELNIFDGDGNLLISGSNEELNIINKDKTTYFNNFYLDDIHTFVKKKKGEY